MHFLGTLYKISKNNNIMPKVLAIVGMPGSGKSAVSRHIKKIGYSVVRLGDLVDVEIEKQDLRSGEDSERRVRESLRKEYGMDAFARLSKDRIDSALEKHEKSGVVIDGLYSMQEYDFFKEAYGCDLQVIAIYASPKTRHARLASRKVRVIPPRKSLERDYAEIKNLNKGGPIALADYTIINEGTAQELCSAIDAVIKAISE